MKVWIAESGENCEGGSVMGVFLSRESAVAVIENDEPSFGGPWVPVAGKAGEWARGCDWATVIEYEVKP